MYYEFFGFREAPFSIAPDPRYLYLSERHKEALAHLMYGVGGQGGFIVITGEVGTGKTTICRCFMEQAPEHVDIALILNPKLSARELLGSICDELGIKVPAGASIKRMIDQLNAHLLDAHAKGRHTVLIIDEAQNLSIDVLEQLRLLTNLETSEKKLLQIVLLGQPELQEILERRELRQLAQRVTARYHLDSLAKDEIPAYVRYRLSVAGQRTDLFTPAALRRVYRMARGIPRLINLICDRSLLGAYAEGVHQVDARTVRQAGREVLGRVGAAGGNMKAERPSLPGVSVGVIIAALVLFTAGLTTYRLGWLNIRINDKGASATLSTPEKATASEPSKTLEAGTSASATTMSGSQPDTSASLAKVSEPDPGGDASPQKASPETSTGQEGNLAPDLDAYQPQGDEKVQAYQVLFRTWGDDYEPASTPYACDYAQTMGLQCIHREGNWRGLQQLNRPVVMRLFNRAGNEFYIALLHLSGDLATISLDGKEYQVRRDLLDKHWLGDYSLVWRMPPGESRKDADRQKWLSLQISQVIDRQGGSVSQRQQLKSMSLVDQVKWFQKSVGLIPDGIPGTVTLIHLNTVLDAKVPRLFDTKQTVDSAKRG